MSSTRRPAPAGSGAVALLDLDGTLIDPRPGITRSVQAGLAAVGVEPEPADAYTSWIGPPLRESFRTHGGVAPEDVDRAIAAYRARFDRIGWREHTVYHGIPEILAELVGGGWTLAVVTSKPEVFARRIVEHRTLDQHLTDVIGSELDGRRSAKGELVAHALERLGVGPARLDRPGTGAPGPGVALARSVVMVGDREHDVAGAVACGVPAVGVTWGYGDAAVLRAEGAAALAHRPADLPAVLAAVTG